MSDPVSRGAVGVPPKRHLLALMHLRMREMVCGACALLGPAALPAAFLINAAMRGPTPFSVVRSANRGKRIWGRMGGECCAEGRRGEG